MQRTATNRGGAAASAAEEAQRRRMTATPVSRLVSRLALPAVASMLAVNLYNAGDAWFVSRLGTSQSGAVGIVFALMAVFQAFGFLFGHGAGSAIARRLGAGDVPGARIFASTGFFLALAFGTLVAAAGLPALDPLARALGSTPTILPHAKAYLRWVLLSGPFLAASCVMNNVLRYEGRAAFAMVGLLSGSFLNLALDPLFMFVFGWGVHGAGVATALAQAVSFAILLSMFREGVTASRISLRFAVFRPPVVGRIVAVGSPSLLRNFFGAIGPTVLNLQAAPWGDGAIAAMSIVGRLSFLMVAIAIGIGQGMQPVLAFNAGAKRGDRVRGAFFFTLAAACALEALLALPCAAAADEVVAWFRADESVVLVGAMALRAQMATLLPVTVTILINMLFQSLGLAGRAAFLSVLRNGLFFLPVILVLPPLLGLRGLAWAQPVADLLALAVSVPFAVRFFSRDPSVARRRG